MHDVYSQGDFSLVLYIMAQNSDIIVIVILTLWAGRSVMDRRSLYRNSGVFTRSGNGDIKAYW